MSLFVGRLEEESVTQQRLLNEKSNTEYRMKSLEEKLTLNEDLVTKVSNLCVVEGIFTLYWD